MQQKIIVKNVSPDYNNKTKSFNIKKNYVLLFFPILRNIQGNSKTDISPMHKLSQFATGNHC